MYTEKIRNGIKAAFTELGKKGYLTRRNFWCCQSCASCDIHGMYFDDAKSVRAKFPKGFAYYHGQDNENIVDDGFCYISYGKADSVDGGAASEDEMKSVGKDVFEALDKSGLVVEWSGDPVDRIKVSL